MQISYDNCQFVGNLSVNQSMMCSSRMSNGFWYPRWFEITTNKKAKLALLNYWCLSVQPLNSEATVYAIAYICENKLN